MTITIKERPILFSAPMVNAILEGRKTQTRRIVKPQPHQNGDFLWWKTGKKEETASSPVGVPGSFIDRCQYGNRGDHLWVRETWALTGRMANAKLSDFLDSEFVLKQHLIHRANADGYDETVQGWRPSIFMPRWASRISLEITGVRVERLQDISKRDAAAEGLYQLPASGRYVINKGEQYFGCANSDPRVVYADLWERINGEDSWDQNPWVWVLEFKRVEQ
jgi:hypothetical protein